MDFRDRIEKSREIQEQVHEATSEVSSIDARLADARRELRDLCEAGPLPLSEAMDKFEQDLDQVSEKGQRTFDEKVGAFTRPRDRNPSLLSQQHKPAPSLAALIDHRMYGDRVVEHHEVLVFLLRDSIHAEGKKAIKAACEGSTLPDADTRQARIEKLGAEVESLEAKKEKLQRRISELVKRVSKLLDTSRTGPGVYPGE